jgi:hypothetical protein
MVMAKLFQHVAVVHDILAVESRLRGGTIEILFTFSGSPAQWAWSFTFQLLFD